MSVRIIVEICFVLLFLLIAGIFRYVVIKKRLVNKWQNHIYIMFGGVAMVDLGIIISKTQSINIYLSVLMAIILGVIINYGYTKTLLSGKNMKKKRKGANL